MDWQAITAIVGASTGIISILGLIYALGWKLGRLTTKVERISEDVKLILSEMRRFEEKLANLTTKVDTVTTRVDTLWEIYIMKPLSERKPPGSNPETKVRWDIPPKGKRFLPPEVKAEIQRIVEAEGDKSWEDKLLMSISKLGVGNLTALGRQENLSLQQILGIIVDYIKKLSQ